MKALLGPTLLCFAHRDEREGGRLLIIHATLMSGTPSTPPFYTPNPLIRLPSGERETRVLIPAKTEELILP